MDRAFKYALIFSVFFHAAIIIEWPFYRHLFTNQNQYKDIEITYLKIKEPPLPAPKSEVLTKATQTKVEFPQPTKMISKELPKGTGVEKAEAMPTKKESATPVEAKKEDTNIVKKPMLEQRSSVEIKQMSIQKSEGITSIDLKSLRLVPPSYAQAVRNKIRKNLDFPKSAVEGDVFVRFIIASDGELRELSIIDEKSTKDGFLRELVFEAIKNSSPFPKFPNDVTVPEVKFTCQISFEIK